MNLSPHFTLQELVESQTATRKGIDNMPPPIELDNLHRVAALLEQVRALVGGPVRVSSGYRSPALNAAVGGAKNSAHVQGLAADITAPGMTPKALAWMVSQSEIMFDQLIYEGTWVHIGLSTGKPRREVLTAHFGNGRTSYTQGML